MARGPSNKPILSFNAGEWGPKLAYRFDLEKYQSACAQLENAIVLTEGAADRRGGTQFINGTNNETIARLEPFTFSLDTAFMLEFTNGRLRFYSNGELVETSPGVPYVLLTSFQTDDLFNLTFAQINDIIYVALGRDNPYKITRVTDTNWTIDPVVFDVPALRDENTSAITLTPAATTGNGINLEASDDLFPDDTTIIGAYFQLGHVRPAATQELGITVDGVSAGLPVFGAWNMRTFGTWTADVLLQRSLDGGGTWETLLVYTGKNDLNIAQPGTEPNANVTYRLKVENWVSGSSTPRAVLEVSAATIYGLGKVVGHISTTEVLVNVITPFYSTDATLVWRESAWSVYRGFPRAVTFHEQRLVFGGNTAQPQTFWGSQTGDYENFQYGTNDTDAFAYTLGSKKRLQIHWLQSQDDLIIGTSLEEWAVGGSQDGQVSLITPTNVRATRQSAHGSNSALAAVLVNEAVLFVQRVGRKVREMTYNLGQQNYLSVDMTILASHVTMGGIVQMAYQSQPHSILWAVTGDGDLIGFTYERGENVTGWHRHTTDGLFKSVAVIPSEDGDELWVVVARVIGGVTKHYVERFNPTQWTAKEDAFFVDSGLSYDGSPETVFGGLNHLIGKTVSILADGSVRANQVVSVAGEITLESAASVVHAGLPYQTIISPMPLNMDPQLGPSATQIKRISKLGLFFLNTLGCKYGPALDQLDTIPFRGTADAMDASAPLFTGEEIVNFDGPYSTDGRIFVVQDQPLPMTLLGINVKYAVTGK